MGIKKELEKNFHSIRKIHDGLIRNLEKWEYLLKGQFSPDNGLSLHCDIGLESKIFN